MASVRNALDYIGRSYDKISIGPLQHSSDYIYLLPGVGSFAQASKALQVLKFDPLSFRSVRLIGICLGMQLLFTDSTEGSLSPGLSLIPGNIRLITDYTSSDNRVRIPHIGWQEMKFYPGNSPFLLAEFLKHDYYFVHSYMAVDVEHKHVIASVKYGGISIPSIVMNNATIGFQFHPEKSGHHGLYLLEKAINYLDSL